MDKLEFKVIDLAKDSDLCVIFRRDSYAASYKNGSEIFDDENGTDGIEYITWLKERINEYPEGCVHAYLQGKIVGQIEMRLRNKELGYINLFYLSPEHRGSGLGSELHNYAESLMKKSGMKRVQLSVSPRNKNALNYYMKFGWVNIGLRSSSNKAYLMELAL